MIGLSKGGFQVSPDTFNIYSKWSVTQLTIILATMPKWGRHSYPADRIYDGVSGSKSLLRHPVHHVTSRMRYGFTGIPRRGLWTCLWTVSCCMSRCCAGKLKRGLFDSHSANRFRLSFEFIHGFECIDQWYSSSSRLAFIQRCDEQRAGEWLTEVEVGSSPTFPIRIPSHRFIRSRRVMRRFTDPDPYT